MAELSSAAPKVCKPKVMDSSADRREVSEGENAVDGIHLSQSKQVSPEDSQPQRLGKGRLILSDVYLCSQLTDLPSVGEQSGDNGQEESARITWQAATSLGEQGAGDQQTPARQPSVRRPDRPCKGCLPGVPGTRAAELGAHAAGPALKESAGGELRRQTITR